METVKEKIAALLTESRLKPVRLEGRKLIRPASSVEIADHLIQNGVTLQDAKPLNEFLSPIDEYQGLKQKYLVFKADSGERVMDCFVLRPQKDLAAAEALRAYANATDNKVLADDIRNWIGECEVLQDATDTNVGDKWVSVDEPPKESGHYWVNIHQKDEEKGEECDMVLDAWYQPNDLLFAPKEVGWTLTNEWHDLTGQMRQYITHWMPVPYPQPPKGVQ